MAYRRILACLPLFCCLSLLAACGDDGPGTQDARFEVVVAEPLRGAVLFPGVAITFSAAVTALSDDVDTTAIRYEWSFGDGDLVTTGEASTTHVYALEGSYTVTLTASELDGEAVVSQAVATAQVDILAAADLALSPVTVTLTSTTVASGDTVRVSFDLSSEASAGDVPIPFLVETFFVDAAGIDTSTPPTDEQVRQLISAEKAREVNERAFEGFSAGDQTNVDIASIVAPADLPSGEYIVLVYADVAGVVGESSRTNNGNWGSRGFTYTNTSDIGPDVIATDIVARPARVNAITSLTFDAAIRNVGNQPALLFDVDVFLSQGNADLDESDRLLGRLAVNNVSPGIPFPLDDITFAVDPPATELGEYYILLAVDPGDTVSETNETNNVGASQRVLVTDEPVPGIDIVVSAFEILPRSTFVAGSVEITATVLNQGTQDADRQTFCRVHISADEFFDGGTEGDRAFDSLQLPALEAGASIDLNRVARIPSWVEPGEYHFFLDCDPSLAIAESDESNNLRALDGTVTVASEANVELAAGAFTVTPLSVGNEGEVTVSLEVCNSGSNGSTPSVARVHVSRDNSFEPADTVLLQSRVPPLDPGACVTISADVPAICDTFESTYTVFARIDANNDVPELDETNNITALPDQLVINGLICSCELDAYEPNDSLARAAFLNPGIREYANLTMCDVATDWYRIPLLRGESARVAIEFDNARGNLDMTLYGTDRSSVLSSSATDGSREEVVFFVAPQSGDYFLKVFGRTSTDRNVYSLVLDVSSRSSGTDLIVVGATVNNATPTLGEALNLTFDAVNLGDVAAGPSLARFYYSTDTTIDPVTDRLVGELALETVTDRLRRTVAITLPDDLAGGESYIGIVVDARDDVSELSEDNNIGVTARFDVDANCYDALEPNNTVETARLLDPSTEPPYLFADLLACSSNRDFYEICGDDGEFLDISVVFDNADGDIDLKLFDEGGTEVDRSESVGPEERVSVDYITGTRCYRLEVYVAGRDREVPYTMTVNQGEAAGELACSRVEEPNNDFGPAVDLRAFLDEDVAVCPVDDVDFYRVPLTAGTNVTVRLVPATGDTSVPTQLRVALFSPARNFITSTVSATETISYRATSTGNHFIRVRSNGDGPRNQRYRVELTGVAGIDLVPSDFVIEPEAAGPGDEIRFTWTLSNTRDAAAAASAYALYLSEDPILDTATDTLLREIELAPVAGFESRLEGRRFNVPTSIIAGGDYTVFLVVDHREQIAEVTERNNTISAPLYIAPRCTADEAEPNNFSFEAVDYGDLSGAPLRVCVGDVDWFTFRPAAAGPVTVDVNFNHADGDLDLYVFANPSSAPIAVSDSVTNNESVTFNAITSTYYIRVDSFYSESNEYTLQIR